MTRQLFLVRVFRISVSKLKEAVVGDFASLMCSQVEAANVVCHLVLNKQLAVEVFDEALTQAFALRARK